MSFNPSFIAEQLYATPTILRVTDTSTGSDSTILGRRLYLRKDDGTYLVPNGVTTNYIAWDITDSYIDVDVLDIDYALEVTVDWLNESDLHTIRITNSSNIRTTQNGNIRILQ